MVSKDKTSITFHSGILTIADVIEVAYKDSHIFLDFGTERSLPELELPDESWCKHHIIKVIPHLKIYDARIFTNTKGMKIKTKLRRSLSHMRIWTIQEC